MKLKQIYNQEPLIFTIDDYLSDLECKHIMTYMTCMGHGLVTSDHTFVKDNARKCEVRWVSHDSSNVLNNIAKRIANTVYKAIGTAEDFQLVKYVKGGEFKSHFDGWHHNDTAESNNNLERGQRIVTCICYLNDVNEGGETEFTNLNLKIKPKKGRVLVFYNVKKDTNMLHPLSEHCGCPVIDSKYIVNLWFRESK